MPVASKAAEASLWRPRRHVAPFGNRDDLPSMFADIAVRHERKRSDAAFVVTRRAMLVNNRRDVTVKTNCLRVNAPNEPERPKQLPHGKSGSKRFRQHSLHIFF